MTSSNGNIFRVTGPLCGEFTGPGEFPAQRPVTRSFDVCFDLRLHGRLSKRSSGWWFETPSWSLWRQCNVGVTVLGHPLTQCWLLKLNNIFFSNHTFWLSTWRALIPLVDINTWRCHDMGMVMVLLASLFVYAGVCVCGGGWGVVAMLLSSYYIADGY